jgi:hypothetical protein
MTRFEIDMLMGAGLPPKVQPVKMAMAVAPLVILMLVSIGLLSEHHRKGIVLASKEAELVGLVQKISARVDDVIFREKVNADIGKSNAYLKEAVDGLGRQTQFTPIVTALAEHLPEDLVFSKISIERREIRKSVRDPSDPLRTTNRMVVSRTMHIVICDITNNESGREIQDYVTALHESEGLGPLIEDIRIISRRDDRLERHDVISYQIDCDLKSEE